MLKALYRSASLRAAAAMGLSGVAFTLGSLILAKVLSSAEYGLISLAIGIVAVSGLTAPLGFDLVVGRRCLRMDRRWWRASLIASLLTGLGTVIVSGAVYQLQPDLLVTVMIATIAMGVAQSAAAHFQGQREFGKAVWLLQISNWTLLAAGLCAAALGLDTAADTWALTTAGIVLVAAGVWWFAIRTQEADAAQPDPGKHFGEALSLVTIQTSGSIFLQLERLLLAPLTGVHDLATFGVLAALVGSPFRMLQAAVQFTLIPSLRAAGSATERRKLLRRESLLVGSAIGAGSIIIWTVAPALAHWFLAGRYDLDAALMVAALVSGILKVFCGFATAAVVALGDERDLRIVSIGSWASILVSVGGAFLGAPWGLVGVLYGISAGWLARCLLTAWLAVPHLRDHAAPSGFSGQPAP